MKKYQSRKKPPGRKIKFSKYVPGNISWKDFFSSKWLIPLIFLFILVILFSIRLISSFDIGFHLAGGRWIAENFAVPVKDSFTYTVNQNDYLDIQWLFQVINFFAFKIFNYEGLTILNSLLMVIMFFLLLKRLKQYNVPLPFSVISLFVTLLAIQMRISNRPEVFTWIGILLVLTIMDNYYWFRKKNLFYLPIIIALWTNLHGLFIIGIFIIGSYTISIWIEEKNPDKHLLKWLVISCLATFINPYFLNGALFPFYLFTRLQSSNIFKNSISELQSPLAVYDSLQFEIILYFLLAALSFILIFVTYKRRSFHQYLILSAFFYISFNAYRNIPIFIIYSTYIIAISVFDIYRDKNLKRYIDKYLILVKTFPYVISLIIILICIRVITNAYYISYGSGITFGIGINKADLPDNAAEFLLKNNLSEKLINQIDLGGWLIWRLPQPVFIDGRLEVMRENFFSEYNNAFKYSGLNALIKKYRPELIVFNHSTAYQWTAQLSELFNWKLVYIDGSIAIYAEKSYADAIPEINVSEEIKKWDLDTNFSTEEISTVLNKKMNTGFEKWIEGLYDVQNNYKELLSFGNFALQTGNSKEAEISYLNFLKKANGNSNEDFYKDVYLNLGEIYLSKPDFNNALICYENFLNIEPENPDVKKKISVIKSRL